MRIIPAIDIMNGKCVRLEKGDFATRKIYSDNPVEMAKLFQDAGMQYLHVVDLDGAKARKIINFKTVEKITAETNLIVDFGGGIHCEEDVKIAFDSGVKQITIGSIAVQNPALLLEWLQKYGADKIILGADCRGRKIATHGWLESSNQDILSFLLSYEKNGVSYSIVTDIEKDGMLAGPSLDLYTEILSATSINLIASGGITTLNDLKLLKELGCEGAIIGKALYEGNISLQELNQFLC